MRRRVEARSETSNVVCPQCLLRDCKSCWAKFSSYRTRYICSRCLGGMGYVLRMRNVQAGSICFSSQRESNRDTRCGEENGRLGIHSTAKFFTLDCARRAIRSSRIHSSRETEIFARISPIYRATNKLLSHGFPSPLLLPTYKFHPGVHYHPHTPINCVRARSNANSLITFSPRMIRGLYVREIRCGGTRAKTYAACVANGVAKELRARSSERVFPTYVGEVQSPTVDYWKRVQVSRSRRRVAQILRASSACLALARRVDTVALWSNRGGCIRRQSASGCGTLARAVYAIPDLTFPQTPHTHAEKYLFYR